MSARLGLLCACLALLPLSTVAAQELRLEGRVTAGGNPVSGQAVALHRVTAQGGETLASTTTDTNGNFTLAVDNAGSEGVFFVATRYEGRFYIGETFRGTFAERYDLPVGPGATPLDLGNAPPARQAAPERSSDNATGVMVVGVALVLLGAALALITRRRTPPGRRILVEIADLDNRNEDSPLPHYAHQRAQLLQRLRESA